MQPFPAFADLVPATAYLNRASGALWIEYADGTSLRVANHARNYIEAGWVLSSHDIVRTADWGLTSTGSPLRSCAVQVPKSGLDIDL